uniref:Pathogensis-related protein 1 n=1 Tax=Panax notoginseng TaxID=44586 RepID=A0A2Z4PG45_9APIA|nr:pathogensis-related protein 1 [Panax notoginseng]
MAFTKISLLIFLSTIFHSSHAQNSPQDYLNAHNAARAQVRVGPMRWDTTVAAYAQNYANTLISSCRLVHSSGSGYGENLAYGFPTLTGTAAVDLWVKEKPYYDYDSNSCIGGVCGHYTQVVWQTSNRLGCGRARCNNGGYIVSCNYAPPGNIIGRRPYVRSLVSSK